MRKKLSTFLREFGPAKAITFSKGMCTPSDRLLTVVTGDNGFTLYGSPGYHLVNRQAMYKLAKPFPSEWYVTTIFDISFDNKDPLQLPESV
jgi:hypothetical protein